MDRLGVVLKSFAPDAEYAHRFLGSFTEHNADRMPLYLVIPDADEPEFSDFARAGATVIPESAFGRYLVDYPVHGNHPGYVNHQLIRMSFWELGLTANYLNLDSELVFVRDFRYSDFMYSEDVPYTFLSEDNEMRVEPEYWHHTWSRRKVQLDNLKAAVELEDPRYLTIHGMGVYSSAVLRSLKEKFLEPRGMSYVDALEISPIPPTWYSFWLQKDRTIPIIMREPVFKTFHNASQHMEYVLKGITNDDIARGYVGVIVNSGYSRRYGIVAPEEPRFQTLGRYVTLPTLMRALWLRGYRRMPRVQRAVDRLRPRS